MELGACAPAATAASGALGRGGHRPALLGTLLGTLCLLPGLLLLARLGLPAARSAVQVRPRRRAWVQGAGAHPLQGGRVPGNRPVGSGGGVEGPFSW